MTTTAQVTFDSYKDIPGYIINLDKDVLRYEQTHSRLTELGFTNISRWRATNCQEEDVNAEIRRFGAGHLERFRTDVEIACVISHFRVMLHFLSGSEPYCLIFEDDVIAHEDFKELSSFSDIHYGDFDLLHFGGIFIAPEPDTGYLDFSTYKTSLGDSTKTHMDNVYVWQIHAYLITREFAFKAMHRYAEWTCSDDYHYPQTDEYFFRAPWFNIKTLIGTPSKYTHKYRLNERFGGNICGILMQDSSYGSNIQQY